MPAGPVGSVWALGSWSATCWAANTWANAAPPPPVAQPVTPARATYRPRAPQRDYQPAWFATEYGNVARAIPPASIRTITASDTMSVLDSVILCDPTSGAITVTLPDPARVQFALLTVKQITSNAHAVTLVPQVGTIDGASSVTVGGINKAVTVQSDGTAWYITGTV